MWSFARFGSLTEKARISPIRNAGNNYANQLLVVGELQSLDFLVGLGP